MNTQQLLEEIEELFSQLREAGYEPSICKDDIPTFLSTQKVHKKNRLFCVLPPSF